MNYEELLSLLKSGKYRLIAIDGRCASGKSTLASMLEKDVDCNVFHMDDFYLPWARKTRERMNEPGGNVDYERFNSEVMKNLVQGSRFSYQPFSCKTQSLMDKIDVEPKSVNIVEGSYSMHPVLSDNYDLKIYVSCDYETRIERLKKRNPSKIEDFISMWIPLEDTYFDTFRIQEKADITITL